MRLLPLALVAVLGLSLGACDLLFPRTPTTPNDLVGPHWVLVEAQVTFDDGTGFTVEFDSLGAYFVEFFADGTLRAQDDCNECGGHYTTGPGNTIDIDEIGCTEMACPAPRPRFGSYAFLLQGDGDRNVNLGISEYHVEDGRLVLSGNLHPRGYVVRLIHRAAD